MDRFPSNNFVSITRIFQFEMAHALSDHRGKCRNIHGHSYSLYVSVSAGIKNNPGDSDDGMIMDFGDLKNLVQEKILNTFDHAIVLSSRDSRSEILHSEEQDNLLILPFTPTCENLITHFASLLVSALPDGMKLFKLKLYETANSYAEWYG